MGEHDTEDSAVSSAMSRHFLSLSRRHTVRALICVPVGPRRGRRERERTLGVLLRLIS